MPLRKGDAIRAWLSVAVVVLLPAVTGWSVPRGVAPVGFAPDEILVKFRASAAGAGSSVTDPAGTGRFRYFQLAGDRFRVREIRPLLRNWDPSRTARGIRGLAALRQRVTPAGRRPDLGRIYRVRVDLEAGGSLEKVLAAYRGRADVEYAERNPIFSICAEPNDPFYADQWALAKIHAAQAWDTCRGSREVVVAVIDTGVDYNHPDLQGNLWINEAEWGGRPGVDDDGNGYVDDIRGYSFLPGIGEPLDDHGHGTAVTGVIAALGNNGTGIAGVCWTVRIMPLKILDATGNGSAADAVPAIYYAVANGADIISASWGGVESSQALQDTIAYATGEGVVFVAAAGNGGSTVPYYPAVYPGVISVAATDSSDGRWYLSNFGDWVDLAAPGSGIVSLRAALSNRTAPSAWSGTSMAVPHVTGACALLLAADPFLRHEELRQILMATGDPIVPGTCSSNRRLNLEKALQAVIPPEGTIRLDHASYAEGTDIGLLVADADLRGAARCVVLVATTGGDEEMVTLTATDVALGVLRGRIPCRNAPVTSGDGMLEVRDGEGIQARYFNVDPNLNADLDSPARWRSAEAVADYHPPTVVSVKVTPGPAAATIELQTNEPVQAEVRYGYAQGGPYRLIQRVAGLSARHSIDLTDLAPQTRYYFVVAITDEAGNETLADNSGQGYSFTTSP